jgi:uncharacterized protein YjbJ (UPF0337 family)
MADLTAEQFKEVPEFLQGDYEQVGEVYRHVGEIKAEKLKGSLNDLDSKTKAQLGELSDKLTEFEKGQQEKIEAAKKEALEKAKSSGDVEAIEKRYQEQMADLEKRVAEKTRAEVTKEFTEKTAGEKAKSIAAQIAAEQAVDADSRETLQEILERRVKVDPETGREIYHDDQGGALSLDRAGFIAEVVKKSPRYARLIKSGVVTNSPGGVNGPGNGGASPAANEKAESAKKNRDLNGFLQAHLN